MSRVLIWDLGTRVLHLAFAGGVTAALVLGFAADEHGPLFAYHKLAGFFAGGALAVRLVLGVVGPRHTRFRDWPLGAGALVRFVVGLLTGRGGAEYAGHNPAAAWVMLGMFAVALGLGATGLTGADEPHEFLAWAMVGLIGAHLAGIALHSVRRREPLALSMVDGRKEAPAEVALRGHGWLRGLVVGSALALWGVVLWRGFDPRADTLALPGLATPLRLGETENEGKGEGRGARHEHAHETHED